MGGLKAEKEKEEPRASRSSDLRPRIEVGRPVGAKGTKKGGESPPPTFNKVMVLLSAVSTSGNNT